jgi:hypothetical protein
MMTRRMHSLRVYFSSPVHIVALLYSILHSNGLRDISAQPVCQFNLARQTSLQMFRAYRIGAFYGRQKAKKRQDDR